MNVNLIELLEQIKWIPSIHITLIDVLQAVIISFALYYLIKSVYKTRAWILVKGLFVIGAVYILICLTEMTVLQYIMQGLFSTILIAIIIMLQPELQKIVEIIGQKRFTDLKSLLTKKQDVPSVLSEKSINELVAACESMSKAKTGALIVIEKGIPLDAYVESGIELKSSISRQLLLNIFEKNTPLHDGAVIVKNNKIESATCYLPLSTNYNIDKGLGTRHRAALGISETSDCIVVVVSEETGAISLCYDGNIQHKITLSDLKNQLQVLSVKDGDKHISERKRKKSPIWIKILAPIMAAFVWLSVMSIHDPIVTKTIRDVPVTTINAQLLDDAGQTYLIREGDTIDIKVKGRRSIIDNLASNHLNAVADFSQMSIVYSIPITVTPTDQYSDVEILSNHTMTLEIEDLVQVEVPVIVQIEDDSNPDYVVSLSELEMNKVLITCSQSTAETLDKALLVVDAYGKDQKFVAVVEPTIYDKNGSVVNSSKISVNVQSIKAVMDVYRVHEIPISVNIETQKPEDLPDFYYVLNNWSCEYQTVRIAGPDDVISTIEKLDLIIPTSQETASAGSFIINLKQHLPDMCHLAKDQKEQIPITLSMNKFTKISLPITANDIFVVNQNQLNKDYEVKLLTQSETVVLYYNDKTITNIDTLVDMLSPTLSINETSLGVYSTKLGLTEVDGVVIIKAPTIQFAIAKKG